MTHVERKVGMTSMGLGGVQRDTLFIPGWSLYLDIGFFCLSLYKYGM
jgi:hypothetical protein